uniref:60S ribosomal protein L18 n=1 Tax=Cyriopagopus schmidti TaxID=29017 RepID=B5M6D7_CYRSC|nr:60S ribosomal protein L18 [Cyriopagopus schmidti]
MTFDTVPLDTPNTCATLVTDAPARLAPTMCPLWNSDRSLTHCALTWNEIIQTAIYSAIAQTLQTISNIQKT